MNSFISEILDIITSKEDSFENIVIVLPSQRAGVFIKNELKNKIDSGFLPQIFSIENFIESISRLRKVDTIQLLFYFYTIYKNNTEKPDSFDVFSSWAVIALQDFNEIDQYLVNSNDLFVYVRDIQRLRKWSVKGEFKETELIKDHSAFLERLGEYYLKLYQLLLNNRFGYRGLIYRESTKQIDQYLHENSDKRFYFIGFNALNKAEEYLFQKFLNFGNSEIFWDLDKSLIKSNHQAASFIKKYLSTWKYYEKNPIPAFQDSLSSQKKIEIIGASKNVAQIKYAGNVLSALENNENTALVLGDESLLNVALSSIPKNENGINITMGYPLKDVPSTKFIHAYFQLFLNQEKLNKTEQHLFYYKDVNRFFKDNMILRLFELERDKIKELEKYLIQQNLAFINLNSWFKNTDSYFNPFRGVANFIQRILSLIDRLKEKVHALEKESLFRFYNAFQQLKTWQETSGYFTDLKVLYKFYQQIISSETISFQGEPLRGLQVMGMLETRVLDFKNVIITSVNEGILPSKSTQSTLISFDVKQAFGLPTYKEKDAIYSYHFFRLLQRAENIFLIYNTDANQYGKGEKSRFISQLELMRNDIVQKTVYTKVSSKKKELKSIAKNSDVIDRLKTLGKHGFSPSSIGTYVRNPIQFYKQYVLKIKQEEALEETIAYNTMGTIVHNALDNLYNPYLNSILTLDVIKEIRKKAPNEIENQFKSEFKSGDYKTGKNRLIFEVAKKFVSRFLDLEQKEIEEGNEIEIVALEEKLFAQIDLNGIEIKLTGSADRIDRYNGMIRVIDYKTGKVEKRQLKLPNFSEMNDDKYRYAIQVMLYGYLYQQTSETSENLEAGILSFRNMNNGLLKVNLSEKFRGEENSITQEKLRDFLRGLEEILLEIFDVNIPFQEKETEK